MKPNSETDPPRDARLAAVLSAALPAPPADAERLDHLARAVLERAALPLARRRRRESWWNHAARWARPAIPLAAAATLLLALLLPERAPAVAVADVWAGEAVEEVLRAPLAQTEWGTLVLGADPASADALLRAALALP